MPTSDATARSAEKLDGRLFLATPIIQFACISGAILYATYYLAPHEFVLGTRASLVTFLVGLASRTIPVGKYASGLQGRYFGLLAEHTRIVFCTSVLIACALATWSAVMFPELRRRYQYLAAIKEAVHLVEADQIGTPPPELLARAFQAMPRRPEVPFILARAVRVLSPDDQDLQPFHDYMSEFLKNLDRDEILRDWSDRQPDRSLIVTEARELPPIDPVTLLVQFSIEVRDQDQVPQYEWGIATLDRFRGGSGSAAHLYRTVLQSFLDLDLRQPPDAAARSRIVDKGIGDLSGAIAAAKAVTSSQGVLLSQSYQEALDRLALLHMERVLLDCASRPASVRSGVEVESFTDLFVRLLIIRRRLMVKDEVLWWRPPNKLYLYHFFSHLSGQPNSTAKDMISRSTDCPAVWTALVALHSAPAFRPFQDPDQWASGTPVSTTFTGSAAAAQLRKWLQLGW